ncbi:hypothetical protein BX616_001971 [Lobosporangium transversale]|nr:hypothetical protein BX616_001971 [Lobosporangium transversale]
MLSVINTSTTLCLQPASVSTSITSSTSSNASMARLVNKAPQPYGVIPPRRKKTSTNRSPNSLSPSLELTLTNTTITTTASTTTTTTTTTTTSTTSTTTSTPNHDSFFAFLFSDSTSSYRSNLWATIKAHCLAFSNTNGRTNRQTNRRDRQGCYRDFAPPEALIVTNSPPVVTLDATSLVTSSSSALFPEDVLLSIHDIDVSGSAMQTIKNDSSTSNHSSNNNIANNASAYPVSVASMDKFKVMGTDLIPLKTFTYCETLIDEVESSLKLDTGAASSPNASTAASGALIRRPLPRVKRSMPKPSPIVEATMSCRRVPVVNQSELPPPLPRHLASRETRSNSAYLRMMATELRMIRSRKLIAPLKPRAFLPRRKDLFSFEEKEEEEEEEEEEIPIGSWTSFSSTESFMSTSSSDYVTAEGEEDDTESDE